MNKTKLYKLIFIIAIYSAAFTLLLISIKNYTSYLSTYKNNKTTQHTKVLSTKHIKKVNCINKIQKNIAKSVLRLHVIANSDSDNDQNLKLKVRDSILHELQTGLNTATSPAQAKQYVASKFQNIKNTADYTIHQNGYSYSVKVFIQNRYFPVKTYGDLTFPAGYYDALCVEIGKAAGPLVALAQGQGFAGVFAVGKQFHDHIIRANAVLVACILPALGNGDAGLFRGVTVGYIIVVVFGGVSLYRVFDDGIGDLIPVFIFRQVFKVPGPIVVCGDGFALEHLAVFHQVDGNAVRTNAVLVVVVVPGFTAGHVYRFHLVGESKGGVGIFRLFDFGL